MELKQVGVVGAGHMGREIALFFAGAGRAVVVVDNDAAALTRCETQLQQAVAVRVKGGKLKERPATELLERLRFTPQLPALNEAQLVVEAIDEELTCKQQLYAELEDLCSEQTVFASSSAHFTPDQLFGALKTPQRALVLRFAAPAATNPLVEVMAGGTTDRALVDALLWQLELAGKLALEVRQSYAGGTTAVAEGLALAACLAVERGLGEVWEVDRIGRETLRQKLGSFAALNLGEATARLAAGLRGYASSGKGWFCPPPRLLQQLSAEVPWEIAEPSTAEIVAERRERIVNHLLGAYFCLSAHSLEAELNCPVDLEEALILGCGLAGPLASMDRLGPRRAWELAHAFAAENEGVSAPALLQERATSNAAWGSQALLRRDEDGVAVLTIRRFRVLNALNASLLAELEAAFAAIACDATIKAVVLRGYGPRAFVSGADIKELAGLSAAPQAEQLALRGQRILGAIEQLGKPVIAAMNGLAFGGGNELAMACHARIAVAGQRVFVGQPEPKLGVIPGYGGTQRLPRWIGLAAAWPLLRCGNPISSAQALELGLIREELPAEKLLTRAIELARAVAAGEVQLPAIPTGPLEIPANLPEVAIGSLSTAIDALLQSATLDGAKTSLEEGLRLEAAAFGRCLDTEDYRIGMDNFLKNGPKVAASFVHC